MLRVENRAWHVANGRVTKVRRVLKSSERLSREEQWHTTSFQLYNKGIHTDMLSRI
jgi:hypothetical protein